MNLAALPSRGSIMEAGGKQFGGSAPAQMALQQSVQTPAMSAPSAPSAGGMSNG